MVVMVWFLFIVWIVIIGMYLLLVRLICVYWLLLGNDILIILDYLMILLFNRFCIESLVEFICSCGCVNSSIVLVRISFRVFIVI